MEMGWFNGSDNQHMSKRTLRNADSKQHSGTNCKRSKAALVEVFARIVFFYL